MNIDPSSKYHLGYRSVLNTPNCIKSEGSKVTKSQSQAVTITEDLVKDPMTIALVPKTYCEALLANTANSDN